jgi:N,N'-diacetylchitobiose transport system substrate-binding protein
MYAAAGIKKLPTTYTQFLGAGNKLMKKFGKNSNFSAFYEPGQNWYVMMTFVKDWGGDIAVSQNGKWKAVFDSPKAVQGLTAYKSMVLKLSRASKTNDEAHPFPSIPFAKGRMASFMGNGWEWPYVFNPKGGAAPKSFAAKMGAYPMPSHIKGKFMPTFLGGSDLAVPVTTKNQSLAVDWIKAFTSSAAESEIAKAGNIANTTTLLAYNASNPKLAPFARAAKYSWFVPTSPNWANVENANVLQDMLVKIFTGRASVKAAANTASSQITRILNTGA